MNKTYRLKAMVIVRILAETTVLVVLILLPLVLLAFGYFQTLPLQAKIVVVILALIALIALPCYGMISWQVTVDELGLSARSLLKRHFVEWQKIERLQLKSSGHWRRYVVEYDGGEITFPVWLNGQKELVDIIRNHLPEGQRGGHGARTGLGTYRQDTISILFQFMRVIIGFLFLGIFWSFYVSVSNNVGAAKSISNGDAWLLLAGCLLATLVIGWRCLVIALMPRYVELTGTGIVVRIVFYEWHTPWQYVKSITPTFFLLPEGYMLHLRRWSFLIGDNLDDADELVATLHERLKK